MFIPFGRGAFHIQSVKHPRSALRGRRQTVQASCNEIVSNRFWIWRQIASPSTRLDVFWSLPSARAAKHYDSRAPRLSLNLIVLGETFMSYAIQVMLLRLTRKIPVIRAWKSKPNQIEMLSQMLNFGLRVQNPKDTKLNAQKSQSGFFPSCYATSLCNIQKYEPDCTYLLWHMSCTTYDTSPAVSSPAGLSQPEGGAFPYCMYIRVHIITILFSSWYRRE